MPSASTACHSKSREVPSCLVTPLKEPLDSFTRSSSISISLSLHQYSCYCKRGIIFDSIKGRDIPSGAAGVGRTQINARDSTSALKQASLLKGMTLPYLLQQSKCPSCHFTRLAQDWLCISSVTKLGITLQRFARDPGPSERFRLPLLILEPTLSCLQRVRNFVQAPSRTAGSVPLLRGEQAFASPPILSLILFSLWGIPGLFPLICGVCYQRALQNEHVLIPGLSPLPLCARTWGKYTIFLLYSNLFAVNIPKTCALTICQWLKSILELSDLKIFGRFK